MSYAIGGLIQASDINSWLTTVNTLYGVGSGSRGYGQPSLQAGVGVGALVSSSHWTNLRTMLTNLANHTGSSISTLVPSASLGTGATVYAHTNTTSPHNYDIGGLVTLVDTNRLNASTDMALTSDAYSLAKSAAWTASTNMSFDATFASEDAARYFFNTGGEIRIRLKATGTLASSTATQDVDWRDLIANKVGTFAIKAATSTRSGSAGTIAGSGFYGLTATAATVFNGANIGGGSSTAYASNDVLIAARVLNVAGVNGGNGTAIRFTVTANDDHTNSYYDSVSSGLSVNIDYYKVGTSFLPTAIAAPTFSTVSAWT